jgi:glycosyltransferase involved in cell wall biosynthesis
MFEVSVIVPTWNAAGVIEEQLDALGGQDGPTTTELIVVDDHSADQTSDVVVAWAARHPEVPMLLLIADRRRGANGSRNGGVAHSTGALVAFADGDDVVHDGWIEALLRGRVDNCLIRGMVWDGTHARVPGSRNGWRWPFGSSMAVDRRLIESVRGFDENIRRGGTETEFAFRAQSAGAARVVDAPDACTYYRLPNSSASVLRRDIERQRGHCYLARKLVHLGLGPRDLSAGVALSTAGHSLLRGVTGRGHQRRGEHLAVALVALVNAFWVLRFRLRLPAARLLGPSTGERYRVVHDSRGVSVDGSGRRREDPDGGVPVVGDGDPTTIT